MLLFVAFEALFAVEAFTAEVFKVLLPGFPPLPATVEVLEVFVDVTFETTLLVDALDETFDAVLDVFETF